MESREKQRVGYFDGFEPIRKGYIIKIEGFDGEYEVGYKRSFGGAIVTFGGKNINEFRKTDGSLPNLSIIKK